jgi:hypothetical protein
MPSRRMLAGGLAACALTVGVGATSLLAGNPNQSLPPGKQALVDAADAFQRGGVPADKSKDRGQPLVVQEDPPPPTGMLGPVGAPMPGTVFTTTNAWAGWVSATTYVVVYAGAPSDNPANGLLLVVGQTGAGGRLDPDAESDGKLVTPPLPGGPLKIVRFDPGQLVIANQGGQEFLFDPASRVFH